MMPLTVPLSLMNIVALSVWAIGWSGNLVRRA
jgi:hypothetical protein